MNTSHSVAEQSASNAGPKSFTLGRRLTLTSSISQMSIGGKKKSFLKRIFGKKKRRAESASEIEIEIEPTKPSSIRSDPEKESTATVRIEEIPVVTVHAGNSEEAKPQLFLENLLKKRGYENLTYYETLATGYHRATTTLQLASYGALTIQIVRNSDVAALEQVLAAGFSPNACNQFHESLLHMACRHGEFALLCAMVEAGASVQICDDYGRTPLHDAFWAPDPAFAVVQHLLERDPGMLFLKDRRGFLPLDYASKDNWPAWKAWFEQHLDDFFPQAQATVFGGPELASYAPNSIALPGSEPSFPEKLVKLVANNVMSIEEARHISQECNEDEELDTAAAAEMGTDIEEESDYDSDYDSDCSPGTEEEEEYCDFIAGHDEMKKQMTI